MKQLASILIIASSFSGCQQNKANKPEPKRPNILFILVDDLGYHDLSITGSPFYETPNIDKLAKESVMFTQGYATASVCSPSRASIMTGKFTARHGITDWIGAPYGEAWRSMNRNSKLLPANYNHELPKADITIAEAFKNAGYKTLFCGKWHLGDKGSYPENHDFDINIGGWEKGRPVGGYFSPWNNPNLPNKTNGENLSMRLAKETSSFIEKNKDSSFFAFLSFYAVHAPIETTQQKWEKYRNKAEAQGIKDSGYTMEREYPIRIVQDNPIYGGLVESMDDAVGYVLNTLDRLGLDKNTIIIFTSDNGGVASGDNFSTSNLPLRGGKGYQWEGGIREPYFIKAPSVNHGASSNYPVTGADFYPTVLDLANLDLLPKQHIDGVSLKPIIEGNILPERPLFWHYPHYGNQGGEPSSIIREGHWKLIHYWEDNRNELYNLKEDPSEQNNIAAQNTETTEKLHNSLMLWLDSVNAKKPLKDPIYNEALAEKNRQNREFKIMPRLEQDRKNVLSKDFKPNATWWDSKVTVD